MAQPPRHDLIGAIVFAVGATLMGWQGVRGITTRQFKLRDGTLLEGRAAVVSGWLGAIAATLMGAMAIWLFATWLRRS
jgi:hypothetical protein